MGVFRHLHLSTRYDRPAARLSAFLAVWVGRVSVITLTEVRSRDLERKGWTVSRAGDIAILTRDDTWTVRVRWNDELSPDPIGSRGGATVHACYVLAEHELGSMVLFTCAHLPADVQDGDRWERSTKVATYRECIDTWSKVVVREPHDGRVVVADWNLDVRRDRWRRYIGAHFPEPLRCSWEGRWPATGTHGRRVIDATWTDLRVRRVRLLRGWRRVSDHRGFVETLRL